MLKANIVVLSGSEGTVGLSSQEIEPILRDASIQVVGQPAQQMLLTSLREQVLVSVGGGSFIFEDQSAEIPPKARLAEIVDGFIRLFVSKGMSQFRAYGFNFDLEFDSRGDLPASQQITERFVRSDQLTRRGNVSLLGSGLRLYFNVGEAKCDLRIEPKGNDVNSPRYFSHINYHYELPSGDFPTQDVLRSDFQGKWGVFVDLLDRLLIES